MQLSNYSNGLIGLDFCGTFFSRQSLSDVSFFWLFGKHSEFVQKYFKNRYISKLIQFAFLFVTTTCTRNKIIYKYTLTYGSKINLDLLNLYFNRNDGLVVFIASGSIYELIESILKFNDINCKVIAASINSSIRDRFKNFCLAPWVGHEKVRRIKLTYPMLSHEKKLTVFETDSHMDDPVKSISNVYILRTQDERFGCNS